MLNHLLAMPCSLGISIRDLRKDSRGLQCYALIPWVQHVQAETYRTPGIFRACQRLLDHTVPNWRAWAAWRPNLDRIRLVEVLEDGQRPTLQALLALEGPDFVGSSGRLSEGVTTSEIVRRLGAPPSAGVIADCVRTRIYQFREGYVGYIL